jgi:hypothetical protein
VTNGKTKLEVLAYDFPALTFVEVLAVNLPTPSGHDEVVNLAPIHGQEYINRFHLRIGWPLHQDREALRSERWAVRTKEEPHLVILALNVP